MLSYDHLCEPISMFQDSFSLSEFILGPLDEDTSESYKPAMFKTNQDIKQEMEQDDYQVAVTDGYQSGLPPAYSPCSYSTYQQVEPASPASCSSSCSSASPTPHGYQLSQPCAYSNYEQGMSFGGGRLVAQDASTHHFGYRSRRRIHDEELPLQEREKRRVRRERNKMAALRCRTRRRERIEVLEKETDDLESQNTAVETDISCLRNQLLQLEQMLRDHKCEKAI